MTGPKKRKKGSGAFSSPATDTLVAKGVRGEEKAPDPFFLYHDAQHDSWTETYDNPEVYRWMLLHQRR